MRCFMCDAEMEKYFDKELMFGGGQRHEYIRCLKCGLVIDKTSYETDIALLVDDIKYGHAICQGKDENPPFDPRWIERLEFQAETLAWMFCQDIFPEDAKAVDYGCGDGKLSDMFQRKYSVLAECGNSNEKPRPAIMKYDKFMKPEGDESYLSDADMKLHSFDIVVSCSVFEHLFGRKDVGEVLDLLNGTGTFCLHVLICEEVPQDPDWFYLLPDHVTLWTNKAMSILYREYGFCGCAYNVEARMWFFFRDRARFEMLQGRHDSMNGTWLFSDGFLDYWKQKPYRS